MPKAAILVDGGFYRRRAQILFGSIPAVDRCTELMDYCWRHLRADQNEKRELYRIFYYDCPPMKKKLYHPLHPSFFMRRARVN